MKSFIVINNYLNYQDLIAISGHDFSLFECELLTVELRKIGLKILYRNIKPAKQEVLF